MDGIRFRCIIGVTQRERESAQELVANLHVKIDFEKAAASDSIRDTVDYRALTRRLIAAAELLASPGLRPSVPGAAAATDLALAAPPLLPEAPLP